MKNSARIPSSIPMVIYFVVRQRTIIMGIEIGLVSICGVGERMVVGEIG